MNLSYWELKSWFSNVDFTIVGSGIVGLNCAIFLKELYPKATVLILDQGVFPQGASTKNAGFACFGSLSEILGDLQSHTEQEVLTLIEKRWNGLQLLRKNLGDQNIDYQNNGGYELFLNNGNLWNQCLENMESVNEMLAPLFGSKVFTIRDNVFNFSNIRESNIFNRFEGQLDTGKMMNQLLKKVQLLGVRIVNSCSVEGYSDQQKSVHVKTNICDFSTDKLLIATNGFAQQLLDEDVKPARAQVLITKSIENLPIRGTFHLDQGYYYFRNIDNRILLGGGRNLDFKAEETTEFGETDLVQNKLEELLRTTILPKTRFEVDHRWSGIMGVGSQKKAIVKLLSNNIACGVRLGGMGVAIGTYIGKELAEIMTKN